MVPGLGENPSMTVAILKSMLRQRKHPQANDTLKEQFTLTTGSVSE